MASQSQCRDGLSGPGEARLVDAAENAFAGPGPLDDRPQLVVRPLHVQVLEPDAALLVCGLPVGRSVTGRPSLCSPRCRSSGSGALSAGSVHEAPPCTLVAGCRQTSCASVVVPVVREVLSARRAPVERDAAAAGAGAPVAGLVRPWGPDTDLRHHEPVSPRPPGRRSGPGRGFGRPGVSGGYGKPTMLAARESGSHARWKFCLATGSGIIGRGAGDGCAAAPDSACAPAGAVQKTRTSAATATRPGKGRITRAPSPRRAPGDREALLDHCTAGQPHRDDRCAVSTPHDPRGESFDRRSGLLDASRGNSPVDSRRGSSRGSTEARVRADGRPRTFPCTPHPALLSTAGAARPRGRGGRAGVGVQIGAGQGPC